MLRKYEIINKRVTFLTISIRDIHNERMLIILKTPLERHLMSRAFFHIKFYIYNYIEIIIKRQSVDI